MSVPGPSATTAAHDRKVFGIGWSNTGTTTLGRCLAILGYNHQGQDLSLVRRLMRNDRARALEIARAKNAFEDWPWSLLYRELDAAFPGSRFILTTRNAERWLRRLRAVFVAEGKVSRELNEIRSFIYGLPFPDVPDDGLLDRFNRHNAEVRAHFASRPGDLLVVDWERGDGWRQVCEFLGHPVPTAPFPHLNRNP